MSTIIDTLITNRTNTTQLVTIRNKIKAGTATSTEKNTYLAGMNAAYNASDLNRVGQAILYLKTELDGLQSELYAEYQTALSDISASLTYPIDNYDLSVTLPTSLYQVSYSYPVATYAVKTDWVASDIPSSTQMSNYLSNVRSIANAAGVAGILPTTVSQLTCDGANNIESALVQAQTFYETYRQNKLDALEAAKDEAVREFVILDSNWWNCGETQSGGY